MRFAAFLAALILTVPAHAQPLLGVGGLATNSAKYSENLGVIYARLGYAFTDRHVIVCLEFGQSISGGDARKHGDIEVRHFGFSVGAKLTNTFGAEIQGVQRSTIQYENIQGTELFPVERAREMIFGAGILIFTHGVSHFTLGYGLERTWRIGYSFQLTD